MLMVREPIVVIDPVGAPILAEAAFLAQCLRIITATIVLLDTGASALQIHTNTCIDYCLVCTLDKEV